MTSRIRSRGWMALVLWCLSGVPCLATSYATPPEPPTICSASVPDEIVRSAFSCDAQRGPFHFRQLGEKPFFRSGIEDFWCERTIQLGSKVIYVWHRKAEGDSRDKFFLVDAKGCIGPVTRLQLYLGAGFYSRERFSILSKPLSARFNDAARESPRRAAAAIAALIHAGEALLVPAMSDSAESRATLPDAWEEGTVLQELPDGSHVVAVAGQGERSGKVFLHEFTVAKDGEIALQSSEEFDLEAARAQRDQPKRETNLLEKFIELFKWR